jgi:hypothetical protein
MVWNRGTQTAVSCVPVDIARLSNLAPSTKVLCSRGRRADIGRQRRREINRHKGFVTPPWARCYRSAPLGHAGQHATTSTG